jgi:hypothetical protein
MGMNFPSSSPQQLFSSTQMARSTSQGIVPTVNRPPVPVITSQFSSSQPNNQPTPVTPPVQQVFPQIQQATSSPPPKVPEALVQKTTQSQDPQIFPEKRKDTILSFDDEPEPEPAAETVLPRDAEKGVHTPELILNQDSQTSEPDNFAGEEDKHGTLEDMLSDDLSSPVDNILEGDTQAIPSPETFFNQEEPTTPTELSLDQTSLADSFLRLDNGHNTSL